MNHKNENLEQATPLQRAVLALKEVRAQFDAYKDEQHEPVAIVGMGCRFPGGANSPEAYWQLLRNGVDAITTVPAGRWDAEKFYDPNPDAPGKISTRHGGFLEAIEQFDSQFFGVSPREAASMDPQQRLFLEVAWEALEHAGCAPDRLLGSKTGVFAGVTMTDYLHLAKQQPVEKIDAYFLTGNCLNVVPGRVSFFLGLHGPSLAIDTACSSSLAAIHLACQSLRANECEMALAGGVNLMLLPEMLISGSRAHMFAADGRCKTFDARADGFVRGEGCGVVVLKRLSAAQKNGDRILAVIRGSAINQDGPSSGLTVPNSEAQKALLRAALHNARIAPRQLQYVEAHGTGTSLGDPIEVRSLGEVLSAGRPSEHPLIIGSAKTNLGHLESAAGVAGLIKTALALHHGEIPPHLHFQKLNPDISLEEINARIPTQLLPWPTWGETRLAGVSAFGMSGTNVHVILAEAPLGSGQLSVISDQRSVGHTRDNAPRTTDNGQSTKDRTAHLLTLSAKDDNALKQMAESYAQHFAAHSELPLPDACYTANVGRAQFRHRVAVVAPSLAQAQTRLKDFAAGIEAPGLIHGEAASGSRKNLAFLYAGQGYQYVGMGQGLYQTQPTFRKALQLCDELFRPYLKTSLLAVLYPESRNTPLKRGIGENNAQRANSDHRSAQHPPNPPQGGNYTEQRATSNEQQTTNNEQQTTDNEQRTTDNEQRTTDNEQGTTDNEQGTINLLDQTFYTQPAMFSLQYALTQLWLSWGFAPTVVMGHSLGEFMAAQLAGVYSLEDAVKLIAERGRLTEDVPAVGMMASVQAREEVVTKALAAYGDNICIAAINGPDSVVITGLKEEVNDLLARFERDGLNVRRLAISNAFHSRFIDPALDNFSRVAAEVTYHQPKLPLVSTLTGQLLRFELQASAIANPTHDPQSTIHDPRIYWRRHLREPVQFYASMRTLHEMGIENFLEIGPNPTQLAMGRRCLPEGYGNWFPSLRQGREDWQQMLESVGGVFVAGFEMDWQRFEQDYRRRRVSLPTYPFQRKRYWIEDSGSRIVDRGSRMEDRQKRSTNNDPQSTINHPLLERCLQSPLIKETIFETQLSTALFPYLEDHKVHGMIVLPLTGHLEIVLAGAKLAFGANVSGLDEIVMHEPLLVPEQEARALQLVFKPEENGAASFQLISLNAAGGGNKNEHKIHVSGKVAAAASHAPLAPLDLQELQARCAEEVTVEDYYQGLWQRGLHFGPQFHGIQKLRRREGEALGQIALPRELQDGQREYHMPPALLDACLQTLVATWPKADDDSTTFLPLNVESYRFHKKPSAQVWSRVALRPAEAANVETRTADVAVYDNDGALVAELRGLLVKRTNAEALQSLLQENLDDWFYEIAWRAKPLASRTAKPEALIAPAQLAAAARALVPEVRAEAGLSAYEELLPQLDQLCAAYVAQALQQLGLRFALNASFAFDELARRLGVIDKHHRLLARMLEMLAEDGVLKQEHGKWRVCRVPEYALPEAQHEALLQKYPASATELNLTHKCGELLAQVLRGAQDPLPLLFPGGSVEVLEQLYQHSPLTQAMNRLAAQALHTLSAALPQERKLRVLEIGAGTGGTSAFVLPHLPGERTDYVFTDVSPLFLHKAQEKFREFAFVRYQPLDIEREPLAQKFEAHSFDVVIATNVVHATADLRQTLRHARRLLASEGVLVLIEGTERERWVDLTFGLTEGWWKFTDTELRHDYALLSKPEWMKLLAELQFTAAHAIPASHESASSGRALAQQALIVARAPIVDSNAVTARAISHAASGRWLIFADQAGVGQQLAATFAAHDQHSVLVSAGEAYSVVDEKRVVLAPERAEDFQRLFHDCDCAGVIYLWAMDNRAYDDMSLEELHQTQKKSGAAVLHLVQALIKAGNSDMPSLWLVTRNAQHVNAQAEAVESTQASLWGLGKIISLEHPELHCVRVDLPSHEEAAVQTLFEEVRARDHEDMVAYRGGERYVARLVRVQPKGEDRRWWIVDGGSKMASNDPRSTIHDPPSTASQQLIIATPGVLDSLQYRSVTRRAPQAHEVEIRVHAVGLNFRDVLNALGMYPGDAGPLGGDCGGTVVAVGHGVTNLRVGEEVLALASGSFSAFVTTHADLVVRKPESLSFAEASAIPSAFLTSSYALLTLGELRAGERVLLHSAAGGVGLAAVQLAQRAGAEIFATAGSEEKREFLRALGVHYVFDSRSLNFAHEVMQFTNGEGVDVVLNSLSGEFIPVSLSVLKDNGRFLEIGKRGIWTRAQVEAFKRIGAYHVIDLAAIAQEQSGLIKTLLAEMSAGFAEGGLRPLPMKLFPAAKVVSAFRCMQGAKHIGKIVVEQVGEDGRSWIVDRGSSQSSHDPQSTIHNPQSTILITGGLAGLGLLTAQWLVEQGARHLALMARSAPSDEARAAIAEMEKRGAKILVAQGDVARETDVKRVLFEIRKSQPPLRGIIHSAGVLDDGALLQQNWERFETVLAPKVHGAWLLHQLTQDEQIELFVLYSSLTSMLGVRGQGNHAMANAFLDGLAQHRRARGQAGVSIHWGAWSEIGAAAARKVGKRAGEQGVGVISPQKGLQALALLLQRNVVEAGVLPVAWAKYAEQFGDTPPPFFTEVIASAPVKAQNQPATTASKARPKILEHLQNAPHNLRKNLLLGYVKDQALRVLGLEASHSLDKEQPLQKLGLDSLMAVELRNVLGSGLGLKRALPATLLFDYPTVTAVTEYLTKDVLALEVSGETQNGKTKTAVVENGKKEAMKEELAQLSEEEAETLLLEELAGK